MPSHPCSSLSHIPAKGAKADQAEKAGKAESDWLPRQCPACGQVTIIGHGRRRRKAHDGSHDWILVRRGICKVCGGTLTVLPGAPYSLLARQQAHDRLAKGWSAEQSAPDCRDPDRIADPSITSNSAVGIGARPAQAFSPGSSP